MKYVQTYEGWFSRFKFKTPKEIVNSVVTYDKDEELNNKIDEALSKININGSNFVDVRTNTPGSNRTVKTRYTSKIDMQVPIEGYIDTKLQLKREYNNVNLYISMSFDHINSTVGKISDNKIHGKYVFSRNAYQKTCTISSGLGNTIDYESSVEDITKLLTSMFTKLVNVDFKEIQKIIDKLEVERLEKKRVEDEYNNKLLNLKNKLDEISDYLIDLEEMSTNHNKEFKDDKLILSYVIPGIQVGKSDEGTAKLVINNVILNIMTSIKTFTKRAEKEIEGIIVKSNFSNNKVIIKLALIPPTRLKKRVGGEGSGPGPLPPIP